MHVVKYPVNTEAPFHFSTTDKIFLHNHSEYDFEKLNELYREINPTAVFCSGWNDNLYLKFCKSLKKKLPITLLFDTEWTGKLKQRIATFIAPFFITNTFTHCWVTGEKQFLYAQKLGFNDKNIFTNFYSCDTNRFTRIHTNHKIKKSINFPHRFIYVGRYYDFKGVEDLWQAFIELKSEQENDWELWCLGTGDVKPVEHESIRHFGFVQPTEMENYCRQTGVFVLPSRFEPWGVVAHEFAAAGFPLVLSNKVGASQTFLHSNKNGHSFQSSNVELLKSILKKIIDTTDEDLIAMGDYSAQLALKISPEKWSKTLQAIISDVRN